MKLNELMDLFEMFGTTADIHWIKTSESYRGYFTLNDIGYVIHIDVKRSPLPSGDKIVLYIGFTVESINGKYRRNIWDLTKLNKDTSKIFGIVFNGISLKLPTIKYDIILFGAHNDNGAVKQRIRIYNTLAKKYSKKLGLGMKDGIKVPTGEYTILYNFALSKTDEQYIDNYVANIPPK